MGFIIWLRGGKGEYYPVDGRKKVKERGVAHEWEEKETGRGPTTGNTVRTGMQISKNNGLISTTPGEERLWISCL